MDKTFQADEAIEIMNKWGAARKPFLFIIDYEMSDIILLDKASLLDDRLAFSFGNGIPNMESLKKEKELVRHPIPFDDYNRAFDQVMDELNYGNTFLLNLTFPTRIENHPSLWNIYKMAEARYKLYIKDKLVVFSPEIFVQVEGREIRSYPMKGTINAHLPDAERLLLEDKKEEAEHYTIVDLIRNDLSQVAKDVHVSRFRYLERIQNQQKHLLQASSEIKGTLPENHLDHLGTWFFKLLPAGSITGAPKKKTTYIIAKAEQGKRGYYTGVTGYFDGENIDSAVMIRYIEKVGDEYFYRSGGGITHQSNAKSEYQELIDKVYLPY